MLIFPALLTLLGIILRINNKFFYWVTVLVATLASGFRSNVGRDYSVYEDFFLGKIPVSGVEPGFIFLSQAFSYLTDDARLGFLLCSAITIFGFGYFFDRICKTHRLLCFHLYLTIPLFFISSLNLVRNHMSIALMLVCLVFFMEKKRIRAIVTFVFTTTLHYSAPILLGPTLLSQKYIKWLTPVLFLFFMALALFLLNYETSIFNETKYHYYLRHVSQNNQVLLGIYGVVALFMFFISSTSSNMPLKVWICAGNFFVFFFIMLWLFSEMGNIWLRVARLFFVSVIVSFAFNLERIKQKLLKDVVTFSVVVLLFIQFVVKYLIDPSFGYLF